MNVGEVLVVFRVTICCMGLTEGSMSTGRSVTAEANILLMRGTTVRCFPILVGIGEQDDGETRDSSQLESSSIDEVKPD